MPIPIETYRTELDAFGTEKLAKKAKQNCKLSDEELAVLEQKEQALERKKSELEKETADFRAARSGLDAEDLKPIEEYIAGLEIEVKKLENSFRTQVIALLAKKMANREIRPETLERAREASEAALQLDAAGKFRDRANQTRGATVFDAQGGSKDLAEGTRRRARKAG